MIKIVDVNGLACVQVFCDRCGKVIDEEANYQWKLDKHGKANSGHIYYTHKACCLAFERARGGSERWACMELYYFPIYLGVNIGMDSNAWAEARRMAALMAGVDLE